MQKPSKSFKGMETATKNAITLESRCKAWQTKNPQVRDVDAPSKTKTTLTNWYCCSKMSLANHY